MPSWWGGTGRHIIPAGALSTNSAFGVFAAGYLVRPLGGMVFGSIGDRLGRKKALQLSVALMAFPTVLIGFLPSYSQIGGAAAVLLIALRLIQGVSVGGELIGSISFITEIAPAKRRGLYGSWSMFSAIVGVMLGSLVATLVHGMLADQQVHDWGWRIPFLAGFFIAGFGVWMRKGMVEIFPTKTRFSGIAIGYNISLAVFGGTAPLVSTWLISKTNDLAAPAYYLMALALVTMTAAWFIRTKSEEELA